MARNGVADARRPREPLRAARKLSGHLVDATRAFVAPDIAGIEYDARNYDTWEPIDLPSLRGLRRADAS